MKFITFLFVSFIFSNLLNPSAHAETGITVYAAEIGIGKFHRKDNSVHPYSNDHAWKPYILANNASLKTPQIIQNSDSTYTIFYSNLDELLASSRKLAIAKNAKIKNFNIHAHGLPGHMWFPRDKKAENSFGCENWRTSATAEDEENYNQYYGAVSKEEIIQIRNLSNQTGGVGIACVTGLKDWEELAPKYNFKSLLTNDAQIHFLSCVVGLGIMGESFTKGIANLLLSGDGARVQTSVNFGLGDWSMSEGMGFWDYQNDTQLKRDNNNYPKNRTDRQEMQKGSIRIAGFLNGIVTTGLISNRDFMFADERDPGTLSSAHWLETSSEIILPKSVAPKFIRIPGTKFKAKVSTQ